MIIVESYTTLRTVSHLSLIMAIWGRVFYVKENWDLERSLVTCKGLCANFLAFSAVYMTLWELL